jgi:hypothetical protein
VDVGFSLAVQYCEAQSWSCHLQLCSIQISLLLPPAALEVICDGRLGGLSGPLSHLYSGYRVSLQGVTLQGLGVDNPPHLAPRLKEESTPSLGLHSLFWGEQNVFCVY